MTGRSITSLPTVSEGWDDIARRLAAGPPVIFLDFDGTLAPIVDDPAAATLPSRTRHVVADLRARWPVAVVSGRDTDDVRTKVGLDGVAYAGSHGFDVIWPDGRREAPAGDFRSSLDAAEGALREALDGLEGVEIERKGFAITVHYRRAPERVHDEVAAIARRIAREHPDLRRTGGKRIHELRPDVDWDKGRAVEWLFDGFDIDAEHAVPLYLGDDLTDEDAFRALGSRGIAVVVQGEDDERATLAGHRLADVDDVASFLERLVGLPGASG